MITKVGIFLQSRPFLLGRAILMTNIVYNQIKHLLDSQIWIFFLNLITENVKQMDLKKSKENNKSSWILSQNNSKQRKLFVTMISSDVKHHLIPCRYIIWQDIRMFVCNYELWSNCQAIFCRKLHKTKLGPFVLRWRNSQSGVTLPFLYSHYAYLAKRFIQIQLLWMSMIYKNHWNSMLPG